MGSLHKERGESKYRDIVESHLQNRLPQERFHSSFIHFATETAPEEILAPPAYSEAHPRLSRRVVLGDEDSDLTEDDADPSSQDIHADADLVGQHFILASIACERSLNEANSNRKSEIDWQHTHTWEELLEQVEEAAVSFNDTSSPWNKVRKVFRSVGSNHKVFKAWLEFLPTQSQYCSIVCGGLKLIFGAASRLKVLREETCKALMQIPLVLARTGSTIETFSASVELQKCSSNLYVAILKTLEHILRYYRGRSTKRVMKAIFKQDEYESELSDKVKTIEFCSQTFKDVAEQEAFHTQRKTLREVKKGDRMIMQQIAHSRSEANLQHLNTTDLIMAESASSQRRIQELQNEVIQQLRADQAKLEALFKTKSNRHETELSALAVEMKRVLKSLLSSNGRIDPRTNDIRRPLYTENQGASAVSALTRERLHTTEQVLALLDFDIELLPNDVETNLRDVWTLSLSAQDRAVTAMGSPQLHSWLTHTQPSALLINGNHGASARQSPLSYICSKLIDSMCSSVGHSRYPSIIACAFFCDQHMDADDPAAGPASMMRNLSAQLVLSYKAFKLTTLKRLLDIDPSDVGELCTIFAELVEQLPRRYLVFCIIDGMTLYEDSPPRCEAAAEATRILLELMETSRSKGGIFKLLVTCPGSSRALYREFNEEEIIWMPKKVDPHGGLTEAKWSASAGVHLSDWLEESTAEEDSAAQR